MDEYTNTAGIAYDLLHTELAVRTDMKKGVIVLESVDSSGIRKNASTLRTQNGNCNFNLTVSATTKMKFINAVAYVTYVDKNSATQTVYSAVQMSNYSS